jgi:hypothetical protein
VYTQFENEWVHVAVSFNAGTATCVLNGLSQTLTTATVTTLQNSNAHFVIGARQGSAYSYFHDGYIANARFWNVARSVSDIIYYQNAVLTGSETGLVGYWKFNNDATDSAGSFDLTLVGSPTYVDSNIAEMTQTVKQFAITDVKYVSGDAKTYLYLSPDTDSFVYDLPITNGRYQSHNISKGTGYKDLATYFTQCKVRCISDNTARATATRFNIATVVDDPLGLCDTTNGCIKIPISGYYNITTQMYLPIGPGLANNTFRVAVYDIYLGTHILNASISFGTGVLASYVGNAKTVYLMKGSAIYSRILHTTGGTWQATNEITLHLLSI